ncbi:tRNA N6-adenosine threonylcarbamoyltransferase, mitochondrial isoform X1 [Patella vulgata]|uniref:tRNA N6-adenosine threonylcarbamoyltransferase, mitochondrial isoform X1 n=2 Tax=Patella vulgata TaxID=6465 RepID=UPI00217FDEE1|nr:tRNA N6-adenosine threonylcarbamoyltransferase, mitochondrial isoform X1 [Patella vulgata]
MSAPLRHATFSLMSYSRYRCIKTATLERQTNLCFWNTNLPSLDLSCYLMSYRFYCQCYRYLRRSSKINKSKVALLPRNNRNNLSTDACTPRYVLGIETSCDDTGAAVVDYHGNIIGEALNSQTRIHVEMGGIIPIIARDLHKQNIANVVDEAIKNAKLSNQDIEAIAVTTEPGLALSLFIGVNHAKMLASKYRKPVIPIHHMEAHALTVRMVERVEFPYLVLLVSGGHCLLALAQDVNKFLLLGRGLDDSPGDAFDKTARQMKLKNLKECAGLSGGEAVELMAKTGNPKSFQFPGVLSQNRDCNFSFSGLKFHAKNLIFQEELKQGIDGGNVLPNAGDICASFQDGIVKHLLHRIRRGLLYSELKQLLPAENKTLVLSGGVASNMYIRQEIENLCQHFNCRLVCPPPKLCTDNGVMIAWNGIEKLKREIDLVQVNDFDEIDLKPRSPLGIDMTEDVIRANIKVRGKLPV